MPKITPPHQPDTQTLHHKIYSTLPHSRRRSRFTYKKRFHFRIYDTARANQEIQIEGTRRLKLIKHMLSNRDQKIVIVSLYPCECLQIYKSLLYIIFRKSTTSERRLTKYLQPVKPSYMQMDRAILDTKLDLRLDQWVMHSSPIESSSSSPQKPSSESNVGTQSSSYDGRNSREEIFKIASTRS